jgi:RNA polymerase sigma-54 factor
MEKPILKMHVKQGVSQKQTQALMMSEKMQQALQLLQLPALEMSQVIDQELEKNPLLEEIEETEDSQEPVVEEIPAEKELSFDDKDLEVLKRLDDDFKDLFSESGDFYKKRNQEEEKAKTFLDQSIKQESSLFEHLMDQANHTFSKQTLPLAELLIGSLDEKGFLQTPLSEIASFHGIEEERLKEVLLQIQDFDPAGVGAIDLRDSLLLQLRRQLKKETLAYFIIDNHYDLLVQNKLPQIGKKLSCTATEIREAVDLHISRLDLQPGAAKSQVVVQNITPDLTITDDGGELKVEVNNDYMPSLRLNSKYLKMLEDPALTVEDKEFIKQKILSAKWLMRNLLQRNDTLEKIGLELIKHQKAYFLDSKGEIVPLQMKTLAEQLSLNESTIARAVANKYVDTPRGILPLRSLFSTSYETQQGEDISQVAVKNLLKEIVDSEDKSRPFSDEAICKIMKERGVCVARRTVAKLRSVLEIANTRQRKVHQ